MATEATKTRTAASGVRIIRDERFPEWHSVTRYLQFLGEFGRTEELGIVSWVAFDADNRRIGEFRGRGARQKALSAILNGDPTEVDRLLP